MIVPKTPFMNPLDVSVPNSLAISTASSTTTLYGSFFYLNKSSQMESLKIAKSIGEICSMGQLGANFWIMASISFWLTDIFSASELLSKSVFFLKLCSKSFLTILIRSLCLGSAFFFIGSFFWAVWAALWANCVRNFKFAAVWACHKFRQFQPDCSLSRPWPCLCVFFLW